MKIRKKKKLLKRNSKIESLENIPSPEKEERKEELLNQIRLVES